jgi:hypothetical protein
MKKTNNEILENLGLVNLEAQTSPVIKEAHGKDWIEFGTEEYKNQYPQFLIDLYYNSSTHAAIINQTAAMIAGQGLQIEDETNLEALVKLKKFIAAANSKETLHEVMCKIAFDLKLHGAFALNIIWSKDRTEISEIHHIGVEKIRSGVPNEMGVVDTYYVSSDWANPRQKNNRPQAVSAFNLKDRTEPNQILYSALYSPNMQLYGTPDYSGCTNWCLTDQYVSEFHLSNIKNGFAGSYFISFNNGVPTREERVQVERQIADKFSGASNAGKFVLTFSDSKDREPTITPISVSNADKQYLALQELLVQNILTGHRVTSPMLMGIKNDTGLGNNADELNQAFEVYLNSVVKPFQAHILKVLTKIFDVNNMNLPVSIIQFTPVTTKFDNETLKEVLTQDELRGELGLEPLEDDEETANEEFSQEKTELDNFIEEFGEDEPEGYDLIDEEVVEFEEEDFDFEKELNEKHKIEFASTGRAYPDAPSSEIGEEGFDREYNLYRVRYEYVEDEFLTRKSGKQREFCKKMMSAKKIYRKEDILRMNKMKVNKGWGKGGADTYNIFYFKGGGNCHHYWLRKIYFFELGKARGKKLKDATAIVGITKARNKGFYPKANDPIVSKPPKRMANNGFVK